MRPVHTDKAPAAIGPYSQAIEVDSFIFTSGQIALKPDGSEEVLSQGIEAQTEQVLQNLKHILEAAGSGLNKVIKTTIFLADIEDFGIVNRIYAQYFQDHRPARSTVVVKTLPKNALVEIEAMAKV